MQSLDFPSEEFNARVDQVRSLGAVNGNMNMDEQGERQECGASTLSAYSIKVHYLYFCLAASSSSDVLKENTERTAS